MSNHNRKNSKKLILENNIQIKGVRAKRASISQQEIDKNKKQTSVRAKRAYLKINIIYVKNKKNHNNKKTLFRIMK